MSGSSGHMSVAQAKAGIARAMKRDMEAAGLTVHETAMRLRISDAEDDESGTKSLALLHKAIACTKKYPHWLWGAWVRVTRNHHAIAELCRQCGGVFLALPSAREADDRSLVRCISEFADLTKQVADARLAGSKGGPGITPDEAELIERAGHDCIRAVCELTHRYNAQAERPSRTFVRTIREASDLQQAGV